MHILFIAPRLPWPLDTGAKIRTFNLIKNIALKNQVTFLSFCFGDDKAAREQLKKSAIAVHCVRAKDKVKLSSIFSKKPISIDKYYSNQMRRKLNQLLQSRNFDLVHFDHLHMGQYRDCIDSLPSVLDEHNVESLILKRCASIEKDWPKKMLFHYQAEKMKRLERELLKRFSKCLAVSEDDKESLSRLSGDSENIAVIPNGVDTEYFKPFRINPTAQTEDALVFTGSMDWLPNSDAVEFFCRDILPLVWQKRPQTRFYIVGKNPAKSIIKLGRQDKRIVIVGAVDDVRPYLIASQVFVAPIRIGAGTRLKILEAMAMGKPVVSTTLGAEGIKCTQGEDIILQDKPRAFAEAINTLLVNEKKRHSLGASARNLVCSNYDWKLIGKKLNHLYQEIVNGAHK